MTTTWPGVIEAYRDRLPVSANTPIITLLEGNTPLVPAPRLSAELEQRGINIGAMGEHVLRAVTHLDVDSDQVETAARTLAELAVA